MGTYFPSGHVTAHYTSNLTNLLRCIQGSSEKQGKTFSYWINLSIEAESSEMLTQQFLCRFILSFMIEMVTHLKIYSILELLSVFFDREVIPILKRRYYFIAHHIRPRRWPPTQPMLGGKQQCVGTLQISKGSSKQLGEQNTPALYSQAAGYKGNE